MGFSIQDYLRKINSRLSFLDIASFAVTTLVLVIFALYLFIQKERQDIPVSYISDSSSSLSQIDTSRPFASRQGKTYTFSWCQGASMIREKNKIYYASEDEAKASGKVLSKFCQK